jgi:hypothetical protein
MELRSNGSLEIYSGRHVDGVAQQVDAEVELEVPLFVGQL